MKVAVTGASRGIGRAIAQRFIEGGARVFACATRPFELPGAAAAVCDVSDEREVARFLAEAPDVLVLNAGVLERAPLEEFTLAQYERVMNVNLRGAFLCARAVFAQMKERGGRIVAIGSISGTLGTPGAAVYNASKWALTGFIKSLAEEGRPRVFCATVLPGGVETDMLKQTPFAPQMQAADVARVVHWLATEAPPAMTGSAVEVFG